jgi:gluconolactonase
MKALYPFILFFFLFACKNAKDEKNPIETDSNTVSITSSIEKLATDFKFTEGPAVDKDGNVYFSDIPNSNIWVWTITDSLKLFRENSNGSNGLYFDEHQNLLACEGYAGQISLTTSEGNYKIIASEYEGKPFNSTNDLWPDKKGGVYFTDPQYGGDLDNLNQGGMHVYYLNPDYKKITRVCNDLTRPNGIVGTADGKILYISDRGAGKTYQYKINDNGSLSDKNLIINQGSDGMTLDKDGNIYITTKDKSQVDVFSNEGKLLKTIEVPESPTNVCFGGKDRNELYITAQNSLYRVGLNTKGVN